LIWERMIQSIIGTIMIFMAIYFHEFSWEIQLEERRETTTTTTMYDCLMHIYSDKVGVVMIPFIANRTCQEGYQCHLSYTMSIPVRFNRTSSLYLGVRRSSSSGFSQHLHPSDFPTPFIKEDGFEVSHLCFDNFVPDLTTNSMHISNRLPTVNDEYNDLPNLIVLRRINYDGRTRQDYDDKFPFLYVNDTEYHDLDRYAQMIRQMIHHV
jgi:hypothetical protein